MQFYKKYAVENGFGLRSCKVKLVRLKVLLLLQKKYDFFSSKCSTIPVRRKKGRGLGSSNNSSKNEDPIREAKKAGKGRKSYTCLMRRRQEYWKLGNGNGVKGKTKGEEG